MSRRSAGWGFAISLTACITTTLAAFQEAANPAPVDAVEAPRWWEAAAGAFAVALICAACAHRLWGRGANFRHHSFIGSGPSLRPRWEERRELRFAIYVLIALWFLDLPTGLIKTWLALQNLSSFPGSTRSFWSFIPSQCFMGPALGLIALWYDRKRLKDEQREAGRCVNCGYDLRATPNRCPECGTVVTTSVAAVN